MSQLIKEFEKYTSDAWINKPLDIERLLERNNETGRNFPAIVYANGFFDNVTITAYTYYLTANEGKCDFQTLKNISAGFISDTGLSLKTDYHMYDSHTLLMRAACSIYSMDNFQELAGLLKAVQCYLVRLFFWVDLCMPWSKLSEAYNKIRKEKEVCP
ncbi:MAG: hypothetical protein LIR50_20680 [Bacillota bacterium]|nr:hypothetical protein [Bacillota bacterium]